MHPTFYQLIVADIRQETKDCVSIAFDVPEHLTARYSFTQGQYLTLKTNINGEEVRRSYSICSSPNDGELRVAVKQVNGGKFSTFANTQLRIGDVLDVMTPVGKFFTPLHIANRNNYVAFAAGSGITPIFSIMKTVLLNEPESSFTLFYGNKSTESIIFREQIEALKNRFLNRLSVHYILSKEAQSSPLFNGHINADKCNKFAKIFFTSADVNAYFLCGPLPMIESVSETLQALGAPKNNIHFELFDTHNLPKKTQTATPDIPQNITSHVALFLDGLRIDFPVPPNTNILEAALANGADLPFACKSGVCCTCKAKLLEGRVSMEVNYGLEPDEIKNGYILTCQSIPLTENITVSFDA
ncbi:MAG: phenylacetate-CoA oxygenase/reductase subunit PaaK [Saprospiraceae bacterium]|nr:phenylacetate-CoA oxygenase/reductase subunit PaaK [Saprospiraceae bacterium]MBP7680114.1 phenylacetate-CoA oxygenase/reductase subunit PaaK [Saprospiraceae bacterium]